MKPSMKLALILVSLLATTVSAQTPGWTELAPMTSTTPPAPARKDAVAFSIGTKGYICTGTDANGNKLNDLWEFNASTLPGTTVWTQRATVPAPARSGAVGFELEGKGYVGTGVDAAGNRLSDMHRYDPASNGWSSVGAVPGQARSEAVGFSIGNKGYVGLGSFDDNGTIATTDFYEIDPVSGSFTAKAQFPVPGPRVGAVGFGIGFHGFVGTGLSGLAQTPTDDFWLYDRTSNQWIPRATFPGSLRAHATGFSLVGYGFIGTGNEGSSLVNDFYRYTPDNDSWTTADGLGAGSPREGAVGFSIGDRGFIGTGDANGTLADFWQLVLPIDCEGIYGGPDVPGTSCDDNDDGTINDQYGPGCVCAGTPSNRWQQGPSVSSPQQNVGRLFGVGFSIGIYGYIALGNEGGSVYNKDVWRYGLADNPDDGIVWTQLPSFPGKAYVGAAAFSIGDKGYICTGSGSFTTNGSPTASRELWEFNTFSYQWTRKTDFPGYPREAAVGYSLDGKGYVGLGLDSLNQVRSDVWQFDPEGGPIENGGHVGTWQAVQDFPGGVRAGAVSFTVGNFAYVGTGHHDANIQGPSQNDLWAMDPNGFWHPRTALTAIGRNGAVAFGLGNKGYLGTGRWHTPPVPPDVTQDLHVTDDFWEFDPASTENGSDGAGSPMGAWTSVEAFGGTARFGAVGFAVGTGEYARGYIGTGNDPAASPIVVKDFWQYTPTTDCLGVFQGPARPGKPCDDDNQFTTNDVYNDNCQCVGTCTDIDNDGICDGIDDCYNLVFPGMIGSSCVDGYPETVFDVLDESCTCLGTVPDSDFDGIADSDDDCPNAPGEQGSPCDDQNPCTTSSFLNAACNCIGTTVDSDLDNVCDAADACPNTPPGEVDETNSSGCSCSQLTASIDDNDPCTLDVCASGVITHSVQDADGDGTCDAQDPCPLLAFLAPGNPCPCANACDINCFVTAGCNCLGIFSGHSDNDGICDAMDNCPLIDGQIGSPCTDPDPCFIDGVIDANCECHGTDSGNHDGDEICDALDPDWQPQTGMGFARRAAVAFSIADSGYIATGQLETGTLLNDLWRYSPSDDTWSQKQNFPSARQSAVAFVINDQAYVGTGWTGAWTKDFYRYDAVANSWTPMADLGSGAPIMGRQNAVAFAVDGKGYVGLGYGEFETNVEDGTAFKQDLWSYDPGTDQWTYVNNPPTGHRTGAIAFTIGNKAYLGMGTTFSFLTFGSDLFEFDPATSGWTQKADLSSVARSYAVSFAIDGKGYVGTGFAGQYSKDFWQYDPATDAWDRQTDLRGGHRQEAAAFAVGGKGYIGTGYGANWYSDLWEFHPSGVCAVGAACDDNDACTTGETWDVSCTCSGGVPNTEDLDQDGVPDCSETATCLNTPAVEVVNASGCSCSQMNDLLDDGIACTLDYCVDAVVEHIEADSDNDGICDALDSCPYLPGQNGDACGGTACLSPGTIVNCVCSSTPLNQPLGDTYATAIPITLDNTGNAALSGNNMPCFTSTYTGAHAQASPDAWYTITTSACASGNMTLSTCSAGTLIDTYLHVLDSTGTSELAFNDDIGISCSFSPYRSALSVGITPNTTYIIVVEGFSTNTGTFSLNVTVPGICAGIPTSPEILVEQPVGTALSGVVAWGGNGSGQSTVPVEAQSGITAIAGGWDFSVALKSDGSVIAWGMNDLGQTDVPVSALSDVTAIAAGGGYSLALKGDGSVIAWGDDTWGQTEVPSSALTGVIAIAAAPFHCLALKNDGSAVAWGRNVAGEATPPLAAQDGVVAIAGGWDFSAALKSDGSVISWGTNNYGQSPAPLAAQAGVVAIATGYDHILALKDDGSVIAWGANSQGQTTVPPSALSSVTAIAACGYHSLALKSDGSVIAWGQDNLGQSAVPSDAQAGIASIAAGREHSLAMKNALLPLDFGDQTVSTTSAAKTFTIRNTGNANLIGIALNKTGANPTDFTLDTGGMLSTLPPGGSTTFSVTFTPSATGARGCTLNVVSNDNNENPYSIALTGNGIIADADGDGVADADDICPGHPDNVDTDSDGIPDGCDSCPLGVTYTVAPIAYAPPSPIATALSNVGPASDDSYMSVPIGFNFKYYGTVYTSAHVVSNGYLAFTSPHFVISIPQVPSPAFENGWVGYWADLNPTAGTVTYETIGTAPNRQFIANYRQVNYFTATPYYSGQVVLNEADNSIEVYVEHSQTTKMSVIGMENLSGTAGIAPPGRNAGFWAATNEAYRFTPGPIEPGGACDDGNACTTGDVINGSCVCAGTLQDTDGDGVCDAADLCTGTASGAGVNASGCSCSQVVISDGDVCTLDACATGNVTHVFQDTDSDGVCDAQDPCTPGVEYSVGPIAFSPTVGTDIPIILVADDSISVALPIGFPLTFYGTTYNSFYACTNGFISFSPFQTPGFVPHQLPWENGNPSNLVAAAWMDLDMRFSGNLSYTLTGSAPNRVLSVSWTDVPVSSNPTLHATLQIQLHEAGNVIEVHNTEKPTDPLSSYIRNIHTEGIQNVPGTRGTAVPGRNNQIWTATNDAYRFTPYSTGPGVSCDDGLPNTSNDILNANCVCAGMPTKPEILVEQPSGNALSGVVAWGDDSNDQTTVPPAALTGVTMASAGAGHTVALKSDGSVMAWGINDNGQTSVPTAAQSGVTAVAAGFHHTVALKNDGSVIAWGDNSFGQTTVPVAAQSNITAIASGYDHTVALKSDGGVVAWGDNDNGQTTVPAAAQSGVIAIAAGGYHTVALKGDGSVIAWGFNDYGQTNIPVEAESGVRAIAAGGIHTLALKSDGSVIAWGSNGHGQTAVPVDAQSGVTAIAGGGIHTLALKSDGSVIAWGGDFYGQATTPFLALSGVTAISGGGSHSVALKNALLPVGFGDQLVATTSVAKSFTIRNTGNASLTGIAVTTSGANSGDFTVNTGGMLTTVPPGGSTTFSVTFTPASTGARGATVHIASNDNNENPYDIDLTGNGVAAPNVQLALIVILEGPYNSATGLMGDNLRTLPSFALTEPFTALGYAHSGGGGGESTSAGVLVVTGNDAIVDWVLLELRSTADPATILASRSALVQRDGDVVDVDGTSPVSFNIASGNYHVAVRHRNHLGCMTAGPVSLSASPVSVDFTTTATATYGTNARKTSSGAVSVQMLWAGDVTFNGVVKYTGSGNDRDPILIAVGSTTPNNVISTYSTRDVNLNGQVKYTGSGNDRDPILVNVGSTTPNNIRVEQLP